jgi:hypothetical protein
VEKIASIMGKWPNFSMIDAIFALAGGDLSGPARAFSGYWRFLDSYFGHVGPFGGQRWALSPEKSE